MTTEDDIVERIDCVVARLAAVEAVVVQITAPLLEAIEPGLAAELIQGIRAGLNIATHDEFQRLAVDEYLQQLADSVEARVRAKIVLAAKPGKNPL